MELMHHFKEITLISGDGESGGGGEDLRVVSLLKRVWVEVPTDIELPIPPHIVVDRDDSQHKGSKQLGRTFPSSSDKVAVLSATSCGTSLLSPTSSSGSSEGHCLSLDKPFPPYVDLVITSGYIPSLLSTPPLRPDSAVDENGGGDNGNTSEEVLPVNEVVYEVYDLEVLDIFIAERTPSALLSTFPDKSIGV